MTPKTFDASVPSDLLSTELSRRSFAKRAALLGVGAGLFGSTATTSVGSVAAPYVYARKKEKTIQSIDPASWGGLNSLRAHGSAVDLLVGCAVVPQLLWDEEGSDAYTQTMIQQASILVAENSMKWSSLRPTATTFDFQDADRLVAFAGQHGQQIRGHNLCWHEALPKWFANTATKENARSILTQHIQTVAGRYAGKLHSWDVVNEAVHLPDGRGDGLRNSPWLDLIGADYIELAFRTAAMADPAAKLTYNDFAIELDTAEQTAKRGQVLMLVRRLHARGVPIHAIGVQSHLQANGPRPGQGLVSMIREAASLGLEVYVTEMDVNSHTLAGGDEEQDRAVAEVYRDYLNLVLREPNVKAVLTWGISDAHTWLNESPQPWTKRADGSRQRPMPFDDQYRATPAFFRMRDAMDASRRPVVSSDAQPKGNADPYAPVVVPGSNGVSGMKPNAHQR